MGKRYMYQMTVERPDIAAVCKPTGMTCTEIVWQEFVLATDYATLEAENAKLRVELEQRVPDGWKLVPVEPTLEMLDAAKEQADCMGDWYRAMLAAAPSAPKADDPVKVQLLEALEELEEAARQVMAGEMATSSIMVERMKARAAIAAARKGEGE